MTVWRDRSLGEYNLYQENLEWSHQLKRNDLSIARYNLHNHFTSVFYIRDHTFQIRLHQLVGRRKNYF